MSDSVSAGKYSQLAGKEMDKKDCIKSHDGSHKWKSQTPFYGAAQCELCKKMVYTK